MEKEKQEIIDIGKKAYYKQLREKNKERLKKNQDNFFYKKGIEQLKKQA